MHQSSTVALMQQNGATLFLFLHRHRWCKDVNKVFFNFFSHTGWKSVLQLHQFQWSCFGKGKSLPKVTSALGCPQSPPGLCNSGDAPIIHQPIRMKDSVLGQRSPLKEFTFIKLSMVKNAFWAIWSFWLQYPSGHWGKTRCAAILADWYPVLTIHPLVQI